MSKKIWDNGVERDATDEELAQWEADKTKDAEEKTAFESSEASRVAAQKSGNTKLLGLGLSQDEITALIGYVPESE
jgi:hypothetical protein|tara:strand:+ start:1763 stop:1990 length:228 start_codon:yes stop_codon:yes gene_type:complete